MDTRVKRIVREQIQDKLATPEEINAGFETWLKQRISRKAYPAKYKRSTKSPSSRVIVRECSDSSHSFMQAFVSKGFRRRFGSGVDPGFTLKGMTRRQDGHESKDGESVRVMTRGELVGLNATIKRAVREAVEFVEISKTLDGWYDEVADSIDDGEPFEAILKQLDVCARLDVGEPFWSAIDDLYRLVTRTQATTRDGSNLLKNIAMLTSRWFSLRNMEAQIRRITREQVSERSPEEDDKIREHAELVGCTYEEAEEDLVAKGEIRKLEARPVRKVKPRIPLSFESTPPTPKSVEFYPPRRADMYQIGEEITSIEGDHGKVTGGRGYDSLWVEWDE